MDKGGDLDIVIAITIIVAAIVMGLLRMVVGLMMEVMVATVVKR